MENCLKMIPSAYYWVDNRFVTIAKGVLKSFKYQTIIDWPSAIGWLLAVRLKWFENKEKPLSLKHLLTNMQFSN